MDKAEIVKKLGMLGLDRVWLADKIPYTYDTTRNSLTEKVAEPSSRFREACERAIKEEEKLRRGTIQEKGDTIWKDVMFSGEETSRIYQGKVIGGYERLEDLYHDAVVVYCDDLIASRQVTAPDADTQLHRPSSAASYASEDGGDQIAG